MPQSALAPHPADTRRRNASQLRHHPRGPPRDLSSLLPAAPEQTLFLPRLATPGSRTRKLDQINTPAEPLSCAKIV
jgi:hypothetical protein